LFGAIPPQSLFDHRGTKRNRLTQRFCSTARSVEMEKTGPLFPRGWSPAHRVTRILFATTAFVRFADSDVARVAVGFGAKRRLRIFDGLTGEKFIAHRQRSLERCADAEGSLGERERQYRRGSC
jgi:hypothetical protein